MISFSEENYNVHILIKIKKKIHMNWKLVLLLIFQVCLIMTFPTKNPYWDKNVGLGKTAHRFYKIN